jgi:uncharacterized protein (UPF0332 family)
MKKEANVKLLMSKADESLSVAGDLLEKGHFGFSASRSYYSMFYAAEAALLHRDLQFSRHSAVMANFNKVFVKTGVFEPTAFKALQKAFDLRSQGDYGLIPLNKEHAEGVLKEADRFVDAVRAYLRREGYALEDTKPAP